MNNKNQIDDTLEQESEKEFNEALAKRRVDFSKNPLAKYTEEELKSFVLEYSSLYEEHKNAINSLITHNEYLHLIRLFNKLINEDENTFYLYLEDWGSNFQNLNKMLFNSIYYYERDDEICKFDRLTSLEDFVDTPVFKNLDPRIVKYLIKFLKNVDEAKMGS